MPQIAIIVEYEIHEGQESGFAALIKEHARRTLFEEDGCLRFEVLKPLDEAGNAVANRMMVSELYADHTALTVHMNSPRLATLRASVGPMLVSRRLITSNVLDDRGDDEGLTPDQLNSSNDG